MNKYQNKNKLWFYNFVIFEINIKHIWKKDKEFLNKKYERFVLLYNKVKIKEKVKEIKYKKQLDNIEKYYLFLFVGFRWY